jgi:formylglycine-generating enzyme required for sulfatase activity
VTRTPAKILVPTLWLLITPLVCFDPTAHASDEWYENSLGMEFVRMPSGSFIMGSPEDISGEKEFPHQVTITMPYYLQTTEVTLRQWRAIMGMPLFGRRKGTGKTPVTRVSWHDCMKFLEKLNERGEGTYRLPTEAEWEYACRGGGSGPYPWGNDMDCTQAMFSNQPLKADDCVDYVKSRGLEADEPAPVGSYPANAWGLYDMNGNVWEWCQDWFEKYPSTAQVDPRGPESGTNKVRRGGSYFSQKDSCRCSNRAYGHPSARYQTTGFRLVREPD